MIFTEDNEEPPALPPRTPEGLQVVEEPVYEAAPETELEPEPEPEPDYEDVGEFDRQDGEAEGDYEDVLEPEVTSSLSYQAGEWSEWKVYGYGSCGPWGFRSQVVN
ncbi:hematopoietic lineage cell-specific protein-like isoform X2 [Apodemus sylvaticus]|uniref:hematopoietic lineage cell-specific protein-like isoform X2 n=1 Tax=Apodemus sylvaticus TaxID=10129 RepID=UPI0022434CD5|nr:hematopoietic lineage cell-specific protein-like isoform X2 [Apodemus sylvaticus]